MGYHNSLVDKIKRVIEKESPESIQLFERDLRDNIATSNKLVGFSLGFMLTFFSTHYLLVSGAISDANVHIFSMHDSDFLRLLVLFLGSICFVAMTLSEFMWRCHKETYDYLYILKRSEFSETGLHDFRIPAAYNVALDLFRDDGTIVSKYFFKIFKFFIIILIISAPISYLFNSIKSEISIDKKELLLFCYFVASSSIFMVLFGIIVTVKSALMANSFVIFYNNGEFSNK